MFFNKTVKMLFYVMSLFTVVFIMSSKIIVRLFAAPEFYEAWKYMPILTVGILLSCMSSLVGGIFTAGKKSIYFFYSSIWGAISSLVLTILGVKYLGLVGVCLAVSASFLCMVILRLKYAWKHINMFDIKYYTLMLSLITCMCLTMTTLRSNLIVSLIAIAILSLMIIINRNETRNIVSLVKTSLLRK